MSISTQPWSTPLPSTSRTLAATHGFALTDGTRGLSDAAPYDRILATCAVNRVPPAWIDQLAPGGRIVAPLTLGGALAVLDHTADGEVTGHVDPHPVYFMSLRSSAHDPIPGGCSYHVPEVRPTGAYHRGTTDTDPAVLANPDFRLWLALHLPTLRIVPTTSGDALIHTDCDRADVHHESIVENTWATIQRGHRLWDTVETAWRTFNQTGRPTRTRLGLTARRTLDEQHLWLDDPDSTYTWPLPH